MRCTVALLACCLRLAHAQTPPDAGSLLNQIRKDLPSPRTLPAESARESVLPAPRPAAGATTVTVEVFEFIGNRLIDRSTLEAFTAPWIGKTVTLDELRAITIGVADFYRARGWIVRTFLPPQDITDGVVSVQVVEATVGLLNVAGPVSVYGGNITLGRSVISTLAGAEVLFKAVNNITTSFTGGPFQTNNGDLVFWADSDANGNGAITTYFSPALNSANGAVATRRPRR